MQQAATNVLHCNGSRTQQATNRAQVHQHRNKRRSVCTSQHWQALALCLQLTGLATTPKHTVGMLQPLAKHLLSQPPCIGFGPCHFTAAVMLAINQFADTRTKLVECPAPAGQQVHCALCRKLAAVGTRCQQHSTEQAKQPQVAVLVLPGPMRCIQCRKQ